MSAAPYVVATTTPPEIVCPEWCTVSKDEHIADLRNQEGFVIHASDTAEVVCVMAVMTPDGMPDPDGEATVEYDGRGLAIAQARELAAALLKAADTLERTTTLRGP
ncbi:hypothetical protein KUV85_06770 [Nocardioides panacisoli]|uniref:DUF6907 domain-containing protein n=1 Tax=Nocardioides panacisoli TaxID=627624 RepID=UPI001C627E54|nr:hypothetical protein [Nocardioides panacisoli]QYJ05376.1 hypothetical protein KUV85_06770 [Nocardioides panacisoli]